MYVNYDFYKNTLGGPIPEAKPAAAEAQAEADITFNLFTEGVVHNPAGSIAYNLMQNDMVALRAVMRLGWEIPNPVNGLEKDKNKRFPFAAVTA